MDSKKEALEIVDAALEELHYLNLNGEAELFAEQVAALGRPSNETLEEAEAGYAVGTLWNKAEIVEQSAGGYPDVVVGSPQESQAAYDALRAGMGD